ncbi:MAG: hypothetical protein M1840_002253 [Geoglossum simile]|nr:MAG: hypothetical protein M1840_002253 [Geoglossum simile]
MDLPTVATRIGSARQSSLSTIAGTLSRAAVDTGQLEDNQALRESSTKAAMEPGSSVREGRHSRDRRKSSLWQVFGSSKELKNERPPRQRDRLKQELGEQTFINENFQHENDSLRREVDRLKDDLNTQQFTIEDLRDELRRGNDRYRNGVIPDKIIEQYRALLNRVEQAAKKICELKGYDSGVLQDAVRELYRDAPDKDQLDNAIDFYNRDTAVDSSKRSSDSDRAADQGITLKSLPLVSYEHFAHEDSMRDRFLLIEKWRFDTVLCVNVQRPSAAPFEHPILTSNKQKILALVTRAFDLPAAPQSQAPAPPTHGTPSSSTPAPTTSRR